jgi:hypothetical protein
MRAAPYSDGATIPFYLRPITTWSARASSLAAGQSAGRSSWKGPRPYSSDSYWLLAFFIFRFRRKRLIVSLAILAIWEHLESFPP